MQNRLYVGNLAADVAVGTLQELFEPHGFVMDVKVVAGDKGGQGLGFALVTMATDESARAATQALDGTRLHGVAIRVVEAQAEGAGGRAGSGGES